LTKEQRYTIEALLHTPMSFSELTDEMLAEIEWELNHRLRMSLDYRHRWNILNNYLTLNIEVFTCYRMEKAL